MKLATRILVPVDVRSVQWQSLDYAELVAAQSGAIMDLLYVLPDSDRWSLARKNAARQALLSIIATLKERHSSPGAASNGATPRPPAFVGFIQHGDPAEAILEFTSLVGHDVIVMGTHGRTGLSHLIRGSVAETVVRLAESPVLVVPGIRLQAAG